MEQVFIILFRETMEAGLIIGILLTYLQRIGETKQYKYVFLGVAAAIVVSLGIAGSFRFALSSFTGKAEALFEGAVMALAGAFITWMILWMNKLGSNVKSDLEGSVGKAVNKKYPYLLISVAFVAVLREGVEMVLFLYATFISTAQINILSALLGMLTAIVIVILLFKEIIRFSLKVFFNITTVILIIIAAGLVAGFVHEFQEFNFLPVIIEHLWDINFIINEKGLVGSILNGFGGYNGNPSLLEVIAYLSYLLIIGGAWLRNLKRPAHNLN